MNISLMDYLIMIEEIMPLVGFTKKKTEAMIENLQNNYMSIENFSAEVAIQCFVRQHKSANADVLRSFLIEYQKNKEVKFNGNTK